MVDHYCRQGQSGRSHGPTAATLLAIVALALDSCAGPVAVPMSQPEVVMNDAWGPFARQCAHTRTSHEVTSGRSGPRQVVTNHESCYGFAAMSATNGAMEITASTTADGPSSAPVLYRILRGPRGMARPASPGDTGLLAQGSDNPDLSKAFARQIGLTEQQIVSPGEELTLPIMLYVPSLVQGTLQCRPDGGAVDRGRRTLVFSCTMNQKVHTDSLNATLRLAGVEEVDVLTGVRLSGSFAGSVVGYDVSDSQSRGRRVDEHVWYERTTEFN